MTDTVVLNAGAGLYVCGKAASVKEGCDMARAALEAGSPMQVSPYISLYLPSTPVQTLDKSISP